MNEATSEFLLQLYQSAYHLPPDRFRDDTLRRLRSLVPFDFSAWGEGQAADRFVTDVVTLDQSPDLLLDWGEIAHEDSVCGLALERLNRPISFDDLPGYRDSFAYNEHWRRFGSRHMLATIMAEPVDGFVSFVNLYREGSQAFTERERSLKSLLMPHISSALRLNREIALERLAEPGEGVAIVNQAGWVLSSQSPFERMLREEWGRARRGLPPTVLPEPGCVARWRGQAIQIRMTPIGLNFLARVRLRHPVERLSPRMAQVADLYASGCSYKEVARTFNIAPATARNHIARAYELLGVNNKSGLMCVLAGGREKFVAEE